MNLRSFELAAIFTAGVAVDMAIYIHELEGWPGFEWSDRDLATQLAAVRHRQGRLLGRMEALGFEMQAEAILQTLTEDVLKSSEIEGEILDRDQVRSSIARRLGMDIGALSPVDRNVEGVVEMMLDATQNHQAPLTNERSSPRWIRRQAHVVEMGKADQDPVRHRPARHQRPRGTRCAGEG